MGKTVATHPTPWRQVILICKKCSKKLDGGFGPGGGDTLGRAVKDAARLAGRRREVRVVEIKCLGLCPKGAVTVLQGSRPADLLAVPAGADAASLIDPSAAG